MSKDIIVLTPNGRRQKIHCTADTSILQVLEDVCHKQGFQPSDYDLKHHNHILDLTTTIRFSNLPNKATLEMVEADRKREETIVTIGLQLEDGERRTADFPPNISLYDIITSLAPVELTSLQHPSIMYMRQEITGEVALRDKTLRQLGLIKGRAIIRLLNKQEEARQANVSAVYRRPPAEEKETKCVEVKQNSKENSEFEQSSNEGASNSIQAQDHKPFSTPDILSKLKESSKRQHIAKQESIPEETPETEVEQVEEVNKDNLAPTEEQPTCSKPSSESIPQENLERRLKIEEEVTFLGAQRAIVFTQPDDVEAEVEDLPDDFYDLTIEEARKLYHELQQQRISLENTPLITASKREDLEKQTSLQQIKLYNNVVVRVQFPDRIIIQAVFLPSNTIEDVKSFIKEHLQNPEREFHIFTTPLKENLDPKTTLLDAKFVPCVHMHFKWLDENKTQHPYLKQEIYTKQTASDAASILASKYRAPSRRKFEDSSNNPQNSNQALPSTSKSSKVPKWFKH